MNLEEFAFNLKPRRGRCGDRSFHRVGFVPIKSLLDGGLPGDVCHSFCVDCSKKLSGTAFLPIRQPKEIQQPQEQAA